jgi:hypothetical protein
VGYPCGGGAERRRRRLLRRYGVVDPLPVMLAWREGSGFWNL